MLAAEHNGSVGAVKLGLSEPSETAGFLPFPGISIHELLKAPSLPFLALI